MYRVRHLDGQVTNVSGLTFGIDQKLLKHREQVTGQPPARWIEQTATRRAIAKIAEIAKIENPTAILFIRVNFAVQRGFIPSELAGRGEVL